MQPKIHSWGPRALFAGGLGTLLALSTLVSADASSHREAPLISKDPVADNTDVYAFVPPDAPNTVALISNWEGFQEPGGGPNYFEFGDDVLYKIYVDNNGDAIEDVTYEFRFSTRLAQPNTFFYGVGPITSPNDRDMSRPQTYTVTKVQGGQRTTMATNVPTAPSNVGPRTTPNYEATAAKAIKRLDGGRGQVFAGQRDDGFYFDGASVFDLGALRPFLPGYEDGSDGIDTFAGYNVQSIAIQVPKKEIVSDSDPVIGVWSTAERQGTRVFQNDNGSQPLNSGPWVQVSRLGNPLVNEVVIPLKLKDAFNSLEPEDDAATLSGVTAPPLSTEGDIPLLTDPILAELEEQIYGITTPPTPRQDLKTIYLTGIPGINQPANVKPAELLRLNTSIAPTPFAQQNRLGLLAGQLDGFPNGRRVIDDVIDISLQAVAGATPLTPEFQVAPNNQLGDGVDGNDMPYLNTFPYLATPHQGTDLNNEARVP
ncbi:MAG: DUF4331 domain-containing protein [Acidimicrobiales bacterium]